MHFPERSASPLKALKTPLCEANFITLVLIIVKFWAAHYPNFPVTLITALKGFIVQATAAKLVEKF
jgi:hypothetical protein